VDGSSFDNTWNTSIGGLLRDSNVIWIHDFSGSCDTTFNMFVELSAIGEA